MWKLFTQYVFYSDWLNFSRLAFHIVKDEDRCIRSFIPKGNVYYPPPALPPYAVYRNGSCISVEHFFYHACFYFLLKIESIIYPAQC